MLDLTALAHKFIIANFLYVNSHKYIILKDMQVKMFEPMKARRFTHGL